MDTQKKDRYTWEELREIIARLRAPGGCPWDREQTHSSLKGCMIEEAYEAVEGIRILEERGDPSNLKEELGDVLMQVFLHSQIAEEEQLFSLEDVVDGISRKMIYRHPHVFGSVEADSPEKVLRNWEELKKKEKGHLSPEEDIAAVPASLPALIRTSKVLKKLDRYYGVFQNEQDSRAEAAEALENLMQSEDPREIRSEAGKLLLQICNILRLKQVSGEEALTDALEKLLKMYEIRV
jgi:tetrapyrrole methylase family protein/MazG family protein